MGNQRRSASNQGFALVELLVALAVAAVGVVPVIVVVAAIAREQPNREELRAAADLCAIEMERATHPAGMAPDPGATGIEAELAGRKFRVTRVVDAPLPSGVRLVVVSVRREGGTKDLAVMRGLR